MRFLEKESRKPSSGCGNRGTAMRPMLLDELGTIADKGGNSDREWQEKIKGITRVHRTPNRVLIGKIAIGERTSEEGNGRKEIKEGILPLPENRQNGIKKF